MGIRKYDYELSVWKESLSAEGQRVDEKKLAIIGGNKMEYLGRATKLKFTTKINGTHTLTFDMPDKYFDSKVGDYVHNEFTDYLFNECKLKFKYKNKWYEFYIKNISDTKHFKSYMRTYTCTDSFIDELSRNGYGITFDEELYNNVEEIGDFSEEILEDSVWEYDAHLNWGDFTEYIEEKLFKIPLSLFGGQLKAHKLNYELEQDLTILNIFSGDSRAAIMSDDIARGVAFWDQYTNSSNKINKLLVDNLTNISSNENGYIYVPYSQLDFCYISSDTSEASGLEDAFAATEEIGTYGNKGYAIAPTSIDPNSLIQFIFIPQGEKVEIDEAGLIVNKEFTYVMTVKEWNEQIVNSNYFYKFENYKENGQTKKVLTTFFSQTDYIYGNRAGYYEGYLDHIGDLEVTYGKKISISDRTEINISEEVDQYVTVYNNASSEYESNLFDKEKENTLDTTQDLKQGKWRGDTDNYRVCSKIETRQIVPQLARNLVQNGKAISSTAGWEIMSSFVSSTTYQNATIELGYIPIENMIDVDGGAYQINTGGVKQSYLIFTPFSCADDTAAQITEENNSIINFGIVGQETKIVKGKTYAIGVNLKSISGNENNDLSGIKLTIGNGEVISDGDYIFDTDNSQPFSIVLNRIIPISDYGIDQKELYGYFLFRAKYNYDNPYIALYSSVPYEIWSCELFEAYTKGQDQFTDGFFKYSGRDLFTDYTNKESTTGYYSSVYTEEQLRSLIIFEDDIMPGDTYQYNHYFIQQLKLKEKDYEGEQTVFDTFAKKAYLNADIEDNTVDNPIKVLPLSSGQYTDDDYEIITNYIDLNNCSAYNAAAASDEFDCSYGSTTANKICLYQKYGYCPYRFQTEKHCRKIRTLKGEKSNRFNLTQQLGKTFEVYPMYYISHQDNGKILSQEQAAAQGTREITQGRADWPDKRVFYITEKGRENKLGFRYEKNLQNISRKIDSDKIITKLYVQDVDSQISKTGLSTIKTAEDNPSKDNFIIDFSYYIAQGLLDRGMVESDLYGINDDMGYLKMLGYLNTQYDSISNKIINLSSASFTELQANLKVNLTGIETAQKELRRLEKEMSRYTYSNLNNYEENPTYQSYVYQYAEQHAILVQLTEQTFYTNNYCIDGQPNHHITVYPPAQLLSDYSIEDIRKNWVDTHNYSYGILGQYNEEYNQINEYLKEQQRYLKRINELSNDFYRKYEPYLKEGTWSDTNYITDNAYYYGALNVAKQGAIPKVSYTITTIDIEPLYQNGDYDFEPADTTYVEDIGMFGINKKTGLPNRLKTLVSSIEEEPDTSANNKITVQDYTTQFEDLFQQVTATVQTLTLNENIYNRSSNFTSQQNIAHDSLQGALDQNDYQLVKTQENNVAIDSEGQSGSDINNHNNKYKLNGQGLFFSNNGGQTWNVGVGPGGINADYIKAGTIDAGKVRITDSNYIYFTWNKEGLAAYRNPREITGTATINDYNIFNRYGLSVVQDGKIKLRAGYAFNGTNGLMSSEHSLGEKVGFYLYNDNGDKIFSTDESSANSARIRVAGEIMATNTTEETMYTYYNTSTNPGYIMNSILCPVVDISGNNQIINGINYNYDDNTGTADFSINFATDIPQIDYVVYIVEDLMEQNKTINEVQITQNNVTTSYIIISRTDRIADNVYKNSLLTQYGQPYLIETKQYILTYQDSNNNEYTQIYFALKPKTSGTFTKCQSTIDDQAVFVWSTIITGSIQIADNIDHPSGAGAFEVGSNQNPAVNYACYGTTSHSGYQVNNTYYGNKSGGSIASNGIALYINNKTLSSTAEEDERLFSCVKKNANTMNNLFSITKKGTVWIGGRIENQGNRGVDELLDKITIKGEKIRIDDTGLYLDFASLKNTQNNNQSIVQYINESSTSSAQSAANNVRTDLLNQIHNHSTQLPAGLVENQGVIDILNGNYTPITPSPLDPTVNPNDPVTIEMLYEVIHCLEQQLQQTILKSNYSYLNTHIN